jgi:hypothetical protein
MTIVISGTIATIVKIETIVTETIAMIEMTINGCSGRDARTTRASL